MLSLSYFHANFSEGHPEAALTMLLPLGALGLNYILPISGAIIILLFVVFISYRQTIEAYPNGGGSYTVAKENLGTHAALLAAAALMLDYILTAAVGIAAGAGALISVLPKLQTHLLLICMVILFVITLVNLRGVRDSGKAFMFPTYAFILSLVAVLAVGVVRAIASGGHPTAIETLPALPPVIQNTATAWLLLRAFASGCTARTGVEAVSNGVRAFREPVVVNARKTLTSIVFILIIMLAGIAYLARAYGIGVSDSSQPGYESMISQLVRAVVGRGSIYYFVMAMVISILALSANTAFADFPRLCQIISKDDFLPHSFSERGRRLVFSYGVIGLALLAGLLLMIFGGVTDRLIPLYAIGAFLAFTLSQAGMVVHWIKQGQQKHLLKMLMNGTGALATGITLIVVLISKFTEGGWISAVIIPIIVTYFLAIRRHYQSVVREISTQLPISFKDTLEPIVVVPLRDWNRGSRKALKFASRLSTNLVCIHIAGDEGRASEWLERWHDLVLEPAKAANLTEPRLVNLPNPYRRVFGPFFDEIDRIEKEHPERPIAIVIPNLVENKWYQFFLHNQRALVFRAELLMRRDPKITLVMVPWYLKD